MTLVKVCGITSLKEALLLEALGVNYLGFNFYPKSKRYISPSQAAIITSQLSTAQAVGIFVNKPLESILTICKQTALALVQLHGEEPEGISKKIPLPVIRAIPVFQDDPLPPSPEGEYEFLLFDSKVGKEFGGTGTPFDWNLLRNFKGKPFFLAGGLGPDNIVRAIEECQPYAVDLNSQVEIEPGIKDIEKVKTCLELIR